MGRSMGEIHSWKLMCDQKRRIFRVHGICQECPQYNVTRVEDRRLTVVTPTVYNKKKSTPTELAVPEFTIDDNYCLIPPPREFSITGLNDNVDEKFLRDLCKKGEEPLEAMVFYDPRTRKHLGMAFMDFDAKWKSDRFIAKHNGKAMMGSVVTCFFDPMAYKISKIYEEMTNTPVPLPKRYWNVKSSKTIAHMRQMLSLRYANEKCVLNQDTNGVTPSEREFRSFSFDTAEIIEVSPTRSPKKPRKNLDKFRNTSFDDTTTNTPREPEPTTSSYQDGISYQHGCITPAKSENCTPPVPAFTPMPTTRRADFPHPLEACSFAASTIADSYSTSRSEAPSQDAVSSYCHSNDVHDRRLSYTPMPTTSHNTSQAQDQVMEPNRPMENNNNAPELKPVVAKSSNKKARRTHRWSSSSDSASSDEESRIATRKLYNKHNDLPPQLRKCKSSNTPSAVATPQPLAPHTPSSAFPIRSQQNSSGDSQSYPNGRLNGGVNGSGGYTLSSMLSPSVPLMSARLPPPGVIVSPALATGSKTPVGSTPQTPSQQGDSASKQRNLEQRLVQIFGKGPNSQSTGTPSTNTPTSSSSSCAPSSIVTAAAAATAYYHQAPSSSSCVAEPPLSVAGRLANSHQQQLDMGPCFTAYIPPAQRKQSRAEIEAEMQRRATADLARERQEKFLRCNDVSRRAHSMISMDLFLSMKKDLARRLEAEAFKFLDVEFEERKKRKAATPTTNTTTTQEAKAKTSYGNTNFLNIFPHFDNAEDTNADSIFGIPYNVRMSAMPSFKKKKPVEVKKPVAPLIPKNKTSSQAEVSSKPDKEEEHRIKVKKEKKLKKKNRIRSPSLESVASQIQRHHKKHAKKDKNSEMHSKEKHHRRSRSPSTSTCATINTTADARKLAKKDDEDENKDPTPSTNASQRASSSEPEADVSAEEDNDDVTLDSPMMPVIDEREKRLRDAEVGCQEEDDEKSGKKSLSEKRALLVSLLRDATPSSEQTPPIEDVIVEIAAADLSKIEQAEIVDESHDSDTENVVFISAAPPSSKRPRVERHLTSLVHTTTLTKPKPLPESRIWPKRSEEEDLAILNELQKKSLNEEDSSYLKVAYMRLWDHFDEIMPNDRKLMWLDPTIPYAPVELPSKVSRFNCEFYYNDPELDGIVPHKTGCARTEGYYKVSRQRKRILRRFDNETGRTVISSQDETAVRHKTQASKDERALNRRLKTWIGDSNLVRVNQLKYRGKMIKFARSRIHGWGLYALETIMPEEMIIEYVGEKIRPTVADEREKNYERRGMGSSYMFRIDGDAVIDATKMGNYGRFINHSCMPNCTARVVMVEGEKRIVIYSKRLIERGEEITYDYKFAREDEASKIECLCGARTCHKYLN